MKKILIILFGIFILASCSRVSGTYASDGSGLVDQIEFVGSNSCTLTYFGMELPATYKIDNGHIIVDGPENLDIMFKIQDSNTLVGESTWNNSVFRKVKPALETGESE
jgi:hypothetical protein